MRCAGTSTRSAARAPATGRPASRRPAARNVVFHRADAMGMFHTGKEVLRSVNGGRTEHLAGRPPVVGDTSGGVNLSSLSYLGRTAGWVVAGDDGAGQRGTAGFPNLSRLPGKGA